MFLCDYNAFRSIELEAFVGLYQIITDVAFSTTAFSVAPAVYIDTWP